MSKVMEFREAENETVGARNYLMSLADAFMETGNFTVAKRLAKLCGDLDRSIDKMGKLFNEQIDEAYKNAQQSSVNMLNGVLAGIELGKRENKDA